MCTCCASDLICLQNAGEMSTFHRGGSHILPHIPWHQFWDQPGLLDKPASRTASQQGGTIAGWECESRALQGGHEGTLRSADGLYHTLKAQPSAGQVCSEQK